VPRSQQVMTPVADVSSNAQNIDASAERVDRADMWERWWAWYPVRVSGYGIVWWEWIKRGPASYRLLPEWD